MTDPYESLGRALVAAARRREATATSGRIRGWLSRRSNAVAFAAVLALTGGAIAVAASGVLEGSPVSEPEGTPTPNAGTGIPTAGGGRVLPLRAPDPEGGLPWGMQLVQTTRGQTCVQIGRVSGGRVGQLGIDGAFRNDRRFHPIGADILPNYTSGYANLICLLPGEVMLGYAPTQDRNAEWGVGRQAASARQLRMVSWWLLGPHAVSLTYDSHSGSKTLAPSGPEGAYMIVEPVREVPARMTIGGFNTGVIVGHRVGLGLGFGRRTAEPGEVTRVVYRFGALTCSVGLPGTGMKPCPILPPAPRSTYEPTHSLHLPVLASAVTQPHRACAGAYLLDPCYKARIEFSAPYAIRNAASEYEIRASSNCHNANPSSWTVNRDIVQHATVRTMSLGYFNCTSDTFEVIYIDQAHSNAAIAGPTSVIVGVGRITKPPDK